MSWQTAAPNYAITLNVDLSNLLTSGPPENLLRPKYANSFNNGRINQEIIADSLCGINGSAMSAGPRSAGIPACGKSYLYTSGVQRDAGKDACAPRPNNMFGALAVFALESNPCRTSGSVTGENRDDGNSNGNVRAM
jgi:hypothetical protein